MPDITTFIDSISPVDPSSAGDSRTRRFMGYYFYVGGVLAALAAAAVLVATAANAQTVGPALSASAASQPAATAATPPPKYSATDIERAFNFMDANKDGKVSREEAAGFRNVAKHFDAANTDKDGRLSLTEFGNAMNRP